MSRSINKVTIIGRLGADPEGKFTPTGKQVATFSMACGRQWNDANGEKHEETEWVNVEAWGKVAELFTNNLHKGELLYVEGRLKTDKYEDANGQKKYFTKVVVNDFMFLGGQRGAGVMQEADADSQPEAASVASNEDAFPF